MSTLVKREATKEVKLRLSRFNANMKWFQAHYPELKLKYGDSFVAVTTEGVLDSDKDARRLIQRIQSKYGSRSGVVIEPVGDGKIELLL